MSKPLAEYFSTIDSSDLVDYGFGSQQNFLTAMYCTRNYDWIITNPPFVLAESFIGKALDIAREGVAMLVRTSFIEGVGRYNNLFRDRPPTICAQFVERVPMVKGRVDRSASTATSSGSEIAFAWTTANPPAE